MFLDNVDFKIVPKLDLNNIINEPNSVYTDTSGTGILRGYNEFDFIDSYGSNLGTFYDPINDKFTIKHIDDLNTEAFDFYKRYYKMDIIFKNDYYGEKEFHCDFEYDIEEKEIENVFAFGVNGSIKKPISRILIDKVDPKYSNLYLPNTMCYIKLYRNNKCLAIFDGLSGEICD